MQFRTLIILFLLLSSLAYGQKKKKKSARDESQATSVGPYYPEENKYVPKSKKGKRRGNGVSREAINNYYDQRELVAKQKRKAEKTLEGPNYSDPTYFGHKRPPKKRKPADMKFCKVCGIRH